MSNVIPKTQRLPARGTVLPFDKDKLSMLARDKVMEQSFKQLDATQNERLEMQVAATASLFAAFCTRLNLSPEEMYRMGSRLMQRQDHHKQANDQSDALTDFIGAKADGRF